jgi:5-deoxy-glucuronate isomerase
LEGYNVIHPQAVPNNLACADLRLAPDSDGEVAVDPTKAGWRYLHFQARLLAPHRPTDLPADFEHAVVPIAGSNIRLSTPGGEFTIQGRSSPFDALPAAAYVPCGIGGKISGAGALVAIASAPASGREGVSRSVVVVGREDIRVEIRGAGNATRQINHIITPDFPADRLEVVEVLTPSGNWSSWPPHKHDTDDWPAEAVLEEVYFYQFQRPEAWGVQRLYRRDRSRECTWEVHSGDCVLVTDGYHPFVAAHGDHAYYVNALAGDRRTMACSYEPAWDRVRSEWAGQQPDPRVPLVR